MEKVKVNHLWLVEDGKRFEEEIDAVNIWNGHVITMTNVEENEQLVCLYSLYEGLNGPEIGWFSEVHEDVAYTVPESGSVPSLEEIAAMSAVELMLFLAGKYGKEAQPA
ncbi:hypothetical protein [Bacillus velezensis]|uniref:hypothetical protein n=1 Tax=Bacillus velezensis TaxID=492670 RepID=UPI000BEB086B|nr:hypothetical protein [Bacillus velezensis]ATL39075.1 hypothetical protein CQJ38_05950 [Bacillus velezensis]USQ54818.1 hypothetical protein NG745_06045 [Bacillus velezensis]UUY39548.1 hypothetical protein NSY19_05935 [Bacillus velezensis]